MRGRTTTLLLATTSLSLAVLGGCAGTGDEDPVTTPAPGATTGTSDRAVTTPTSAGTSTTGDMTAEPVPELTAGDVLTPDDSGSTLRLTVGAEATFRWEPSPGGIGSSVVTPDVVEVVPVDYLADPGYAEVTLLGLVPGESEVVLTAQDDPGDRVELTVVVDEQR